HHRKKKDLLTVYRRSTCSPHHPLHSEPSPYTLHSKRDDLVFLPPLFLPGSLSLSSPSLYPTFSVKIYQDILSLADTGTLATCSQVSLCFFKIASDSCTRTSRLKESSSWVSSSANERALQPAPRLPRSNLPPRRRFRLDGFLSPSTPSSQSTTRSGPSHRSATSFQTQPSVTPQDHRSQSTSPPVQPVLVRLRLSSTLRLRIPRLVPNGAAVALESTLSPRTFPRQLLDLPRHPPLLLPFLVALLR
ncbi:hypothetical protein BDY24DRAFT_438120, partial [Mrakia frigida]|uniref:uncharacterized protein n=1 Tax=Mrakia frigida TaxID=29902 RepID=UPI003FCC229C